MSLLKKLQTYLQQNHPWIDVGNRHSIMTEQWSHVRFELGDEFENGTLERVEQATQRAFSVFMDAFENSDEVIVLAYGYHGESFWGGSVSYLYEQLPSREDFDFSITDDGELIEGIISICWTEKSKINVKNILAAIANTEMGFEPKLAQSVYFIDPATNTVFYMYDDRGCLVCNVNPLVIKPLFDKYNHWLVDYHRTKIEAFFSA